MSLLQNSNAISTAGGYDVNNSLRFRSSASAYLSRTPASAGNLQKWTYSAWVKRGRIGTGSGFYQNLLDATGSTNVYHNIRFIDDNLTLTLDNTGTITTTAVFRDPSAWYHIVVVWDTPNATSTDRVILYVNGVRQTVTGTYPAQNTNGQVNSTNAHAIGRYIFGNAQFFDGYMAEVNFINGQALTPSSFGATDATTGVWQPKAYTGTYGTNGFYLKFSDIATTSGSNAGLGKDFSGNSNYWTTNNISVTSGTTYDAMKDVPTNTSATVANYAVLNPLKPSDSGWTKTISDANLSTSITYVSGPNMVTIPVTIATPSSGKWYWEVTPTSALTTGVTTGIGVTTTTTFIDGASPPASSYGYSGGGTKFNDIANNVAYGATYATNDVIGVALDIDGGTITFYKNNVSQGNAYTGLSAVPYYPCIFDNASGTRAFSINFGQRPFSYTPPTGYLALNTYNLPTPTILQGNKYMDATLYTGNGATRSITNDGSFKPDFVWIKARSIAYFHRLADSVRGTGKELYSNDTGAETTNQADGYVSAFNSNGFSILGGAGVNLNANTFVAWQWQAGQGSTSSNTSGSITSTVSVNTTAGFSIVTYTGTLSSAGTATVGHGLGTAPKMIITKKRSNTSAWVVLHTSLTNWNTAVYLNLTNAAGSISGNGTMSAPTSSVFSTNWTDGMNINGDTFVAYCWAEIAGFSKFGSYTGNGSADNVFVYCGFKPRFIMTKRTDSTGSWYMFDTARNTYNVLGEELIANTSAAGVTATDLDILSNGFKWRAAISGTWIFMAFAESPFKNSLAQ